MLSADYRAAKALMELRLAEASSPDRERNAGQGHLGAPGLDPGQRLVRKLALALVSSGGRLVGAGLPPRPPSVRTRA